MASRHGTLVFICLGRGRSRSSGPKQRQQQQQEQHRDNLQARVEAILLHLCQQGEEITLSGVSCALGHSATYLSYYEDIVQRVRAVAEVHNKQRKQRQIEALCATLEDTLFTCQTGKRR